MLNYEQQRCKIKRAIRRITNLKRHGAGERKEPMMPKTERSRFTLKQGISNTAVLKPRPAETEDVNPCKEECLISTVNGTVRTCRCGIYHVQLSAMTLHLTPLQFEATARLFKLAWGMVVGRRMSVSMSGLKRLPVVALLLATLLSWSDPSLTSAATSFLVLAPDRGAIGNQETQTVFQAFKQSYPAEIALAGREYGGAPGDYSAYLSRAIKDLEANGATDIVAIPLFLSPIDPVLKKVQPRLPDPAKGSSIRWAAPMKESHLIAQILLDRLDALSPDCQQGGPLAPETILSTARRFDLTEKT